MNRLFLRHVIWRFLRHSAVLEPRGKRCRASGFTLVEVMVAMAVVAVALPALLFALIQQLDGTEHLRDRTIASWVAANQLTSLRLMVAKDGALPSGRLSGETRMADRDWYWSVEQEKTEVPGFIRVEIQVAANSDLDSTPLYSLNGFLAPENINGTP